MKKSSKQSQYAKEILINVETKETRCAVLHYGTLQNLIVERSKNKQLSGNIYRGRVTNILRNIQSAFIDINESENGFIHISDIVENTQKFQSMFDMDFDWEYESAAGSKKSQEADISKQLKIDQPVIVQVVKEPIGTKGARLTSNITIPGRYLVLLPNTPHRGVSRKISDRTARERLKRVIRNFEMPRDMGLICRTASLNTSTERLIEEANELLEAWKDIVDKFHKSAGSVCLYEESDLIKKSLIMAIDKKFDRILVDDFQTYQKLKRLQKKYEDEDHQLKIEVYRDANCMFERFAIQREIEKAMNRKIWLPSGGYLYFDKTEAMYTIDVNSGRSNQTDLHQDVEETLVHVNMEAAEEIARQLRLRNVGGLIICDFIDMRSRKNQRRVLDKLKEAMKEDQAKCTILGMSEFGLVEMTRQRLRESLIQTLFTACPYCSGKGMIKNHESVAIEIERVLKKIVEAHEPQDLHLYTHPHFADYLKEEEKNHLTKLAKKRKVALTFHANDSLHLNQFEFYQMDNGQLLEI